MYGGGGIAPDERYEALKPNRFQGTLSGRGAFFYFSARYFGPRDAKLPESWDIDEATLAEFRKFLHESATAYLEGEFSQNIEWVKRQLKLEMYTTAFGKERSDETAAASDPEVLKAAESLPKARALLDKSRRMVAQRKGQNFR